MTKRDVTPDCSSLDELTPPISVNESNSCRNHIPAPSKGELAQACALIGCDGECRAAESPEGFSRRQVLLRRQAVGPDADPSVLMELVRFAGKSARGRIRGPKHRLTTPVSRVLLLTGKLRCGPPRPWGQNQWQDLYMPFPSAEPAASAGYLRRRIPNCVTIRPAQMTGGG